MIYSCGTRSALMPPSLSRHGQASSRLRPRTPAVQNDRLTDSVGTMLAYANDVDYGSISSSP